MGTFARKNEYGKIPRWQAAFWGCLAAGCSAVTIFLLAAVSPDPAAVGDAYGNTTTLSPEETVQGVPTVPVDQAAVQSPAAEPPLSGSGYREAWQSPLTAAGVSGSTPDLSAPGYYVSMQGSDAGDGSAANPWASFQYAVSRLRAGDTLYILDGHYKDSALLSQSGRADAYIRIVGVGNVVIGGRDASDFMAEAAFDTAGHSYIRFENLTVNHAKMAVEVRPGSSYLVVDGLRTDGNRFALRIQDSTNITVRNAYAVNSNNAFRVYGASRNLVFENIETYGSKDIWDGMSLNYRNGDGFIMERTVSNVTLRNIISGDHWDAGFDIKASSVLIENVVTFGNKNNFKMWGDNITIRNSLSFGAKRQPRPDGSTVEGHGITVEDGTTTVVNVTFVGNEHFDVRVYADGALWIKNSIVARQASTGWLFRSDGYAASENVLWFDAGRTGPNADLRLAATDLWGDPHFVDWAAGNYRLTGTSQAVDRGDPSADNAAYDLDGKDRSVGESVDLGAYEYQHNGVPDPGPSPAPVPDPVPAPVPVPEPGPAPAPQPDPTAPFVGVQDGGTVSGRIFVQPSAELMPNVKIVRYFMDGRMKEKQSRPPFLFGGAKGFDTRRYKDGTYELKAVVETRSGGVLTYSVTIHIRNKTARR